MVERTTLWRASLAILLLVSVGLAFGGCRIVRPPLQELGGAGCYKQAGPSKTSMIVRQWERDSGHNERFVDKYFLNYDINDPYRGDCLVGH